MSETGNILYRVIETMTTNEFDPEAWKNDVQNGCFVHCDGWPEALAESQKNILYAAIALAEQELVDPAEEEAILEKARQHARADLEVNVACRQECPTGGFGLFEDGEEMENDDSPIVRACPIKGRLAAIVARHNLATEEAQP